MAMHALLLRAIFSEEQLDEYHLVLVLAFIGFYKA